MRRIKIDLSSKSVLGAIKALETYKVDLVAKCEQMAEELSKRGIQIAKDTVSTGYGTYIAFFTELNPNETGCTAIMVASQAGTIHAEWQTEEGVKTADVSPLLMAEYGAGQYAISGHRGSFPGQTHAFDDGWSWRDLDGVWHRISGIHPQRPMATAMNEMLTIIREVADEVFGNGR